MICRVPEEVQEAAEAALAEAAEAVASAAEALAEVIAEEVSEADRAPEVFIIHRIITIITTVPSSVGVGVQDTIITAAEAVQ